MYTCVACACQEWYEEISRALNHSWVDMGKLPQAAALIVTLIPRDPEAFVAIIFVCNLDNYMEWVR